VTVTRYITCLMLFLDGLFIYLSRLCHCLHRTVATVNCTTASSGPGPPHYRGFTMTFRRTTLLWTSDQPNAETSLYLATHNTHKRHIHATGENFFFCLSGVFSLWSIFVVFKSFRPSCHFTSHTTVLTTNTTQTSIPPVGFFFFACPGFFPFDPFLYCLNPFVLHVTLRSILPSLQHNTTQTSMPPARFEPTIPASERPLGSVVNGT
jgi:hypothetical protein